MSALLQLYGCVGLLQPTDGDLSLRLRCGATTVTVSVFTAVATIGEAPATRQALRALAQTSWPSRRQAARLV